MVELLDQDLQHQLQRGFNTKEELYQRLDSLPEDESEKFLRLFSNPDITLSFAGSPTKNAIRNAIPSLFAALSKFAAGFEGTVHTANIEDSRLSNVIREIGVARGSFNGPLFNPQIVSWVGDPTVVTIADKLSKGQTYQTRLPLELIAYISSNPMFPDNVWIPRLEQYLSVQDSISPFEKIWVVDLSSDRIAFEWADG